MLTAILFGNTKPGVLDLVVIIVLSCSTTGSQGQGFCMHNQFRCSNGQCISTEKLCNGKNDCPRGEDEKGNGGRWNCQYQVLSKDSCDPATQFKCRFGGCISRSSLCNSQVNCWGGGDEALDVCSGRKTPVTSSIFTQLPPKPVQIQPNPIISTVQSPTTTRSAFPSQPSGGSLGGACGPIRDESYRGFKVVCETSRRWMVDCAEAPPGSSAIYTCEKYFTPISSLVQEATRRCENGKWSPLNYRFACEADCGNSVNELGAFIVGGSTAKAGKWPWMVAIFEWNSRSNKMDFICGASLISSQAVITAAHCVVRRDSGKKKSFASLKLVMGKYYRSFDRKSTGEQERNVADIFVPVEYNRVTLNSDIAIIKLAEAVQITETVRPVCLPQRGDYTEPEQLGTLVGWGRGDGKSFHEQLQQAQLPVILGQKCVDSHPQFASLVHEGTFCAGYRNGTSACDGDSGGPLVFRDRYSPSKYILHGVVSAGIASSDGRSGCNPNYYTVFTNVGHHTIRRWISNTIDANFGSKPNE